MKKPLILGLSLLTIGTAFKPGTVGIVAHADEIDSYELQDTQESTINDVEKNELWIEMEKEVYTTAQRTALLTPEAETAKMEYL
ncbi:hypothetical protein [Enterococcus faecalis]|uniref:hypothetical protein n=1 Tax=Enterococcus faecalis TaxID=1351 RepID=UPI002DBCF3FE|nr:hypothetical protein [Enterococcus faecalis]MEB7792189.1 hypothetical protein [Enterococcus faecalis]MEB7810211.1 hypothetical protein [Enterococcus faecalis]